MSVIERGSQSNPGAAILSSDWSGLSPHLIARFYPVTRSEVGAWSRESGSIEVQAPLTDARVEQSENWHSPFENQTADAKLPTLSALFQSGAFQQPLAALQNFIANGDGIGGSVLSIAQRQLQTLAGRSAVTKLNSTQVFSGAPPLKITATVHFRAMLNATSEVRQPMDQLMSWVLPKHLDQEGFFGRVTKGKLFSVDTLYPSFAPQVIGFQYADSLFIPMVIESISQPLTGARDSAGHLLHAAIAITLGSLTALDKDDWAATRQYQTFDRKF